jgi:hypothetical protein
MNELSPFESVIIGFVSIVIGVAVVILLLAVALTEHLFGQTGVNVLCCGLIIATLVVATWFAIGVFEKIDASW